VLVELLCTAFQSGPFGKAISGVGEDGKAIPMPLGHFFLAVDVSKFLDPKIFRANASALLAGLRASRKDPTLGGRIYTAGEPEHDARVERTGRGGLMLPVSLQKNMIAIRDARPDLKAKYPKFDFE
jgi:LDH2 family malate/lactate/ureidoglycolate dehydrogenase